MGSENATQGHLLSSWVKEIKKNNIEGHFVASFIISETIVLVVSLAVMEN